MTSWTYINSEPGLYTVGFYSPAGDWHPDSDQTDRETAAARVHWLNGGQVHRDRKPEPAGLEAAGLVLAVLQQHAGEPGDPFSGLTTDQVTTRTDLTMSTVLSALHQLDATGAVRRDVLTRCWHATDNGATGVQ